MKQMELEAFPEVPECRRGSELGCGPWKKWSSVYCSLETESSGLEPQGSTLTITSLSQDIMLFSAPFIQRK